ncbi:tripartite tricarboxylate transporter TctB family protein [Sinobaca sp. H24]|uniref:tripartite tricarboxylate transporter TctB family protein n=1 Tax=Sinobaca sp. H24 TaxID=2923376 RepID=UPI00207AFA79|nr:tripartite tricarboxylate transporter TctB family protein [Sinobaca sp. H24]
MAVWKASAPGFIMGIVSILIFSQALLMEGQSIVDPSSGSFFPALISFIMFGTSLWTIYQSNKSRRSASDLSSEEVDESELEEDREPFSKKDYTFILLYFAIVVLFVLLLPLLSFFPAAFIFLAASMLYLRNVSWKLNIAVSVVSVTVIFFLFSEFFNIVFP